MNKIKYDKIKNMKTRGNRNSMDIYKDCLLWFWYGK